jgi:hypothetical protein
MRPFFVAVGYQLESDEMNCKPVLKNKIVSLFVRCVRRFEAFAPLVFSKG